MPKHHTSRTEGAGRPPQPRDVHDIRALTATGAITLPVHRPQPERGDASAEETSRPSR